MKHPVVLKMFIIRVDFIIKADILVKTSNRTLYIHEYNDIYGYEFQSFTASEPMHIILWIGMILICKV